MDVSSIAFQSFATGAINTGGSEGGGGAAGTFVPKSAHTAQVTPIATAATSTTEVKTPAASNPVQSVQQLTQALKLVNDSFSLRGQNLYATFDRDQATGINVVKIVDKNTKEVISQIPSKQMIEFAQLLDQSKANGGQLVNVKA
jgi:flagellar protein FlaG